MAYDWPKSGSKWPQSGLFCPRKGPWKTAVAVGPWKIAVAVGPWLLAKSIAVAVGPVFCKLGSSMKSQY